MFITAEDQRYKSRASFWRDRKPMIHSARIRYVCSMTVWTSRVTMDGQTVRRIFCTHIAVKPDGPESSPVPFVIRSELGLGIPDSGIPIAPFLTVPSRILEVVPARQA